jgi:putative endonuclease
MQEVVGSTPILSTLIPQKRDFFMLFYICIIYSASLDKYYTGSCENVQVRLESQHNAERNKSAKAGIPWLLRYTETYSTRTAAVAWENEIKRKKSRKYIEWLVSSSEGSGGQSVPKAIGKVVPIAIGILSTYSTTVLQARGVFLCQFDNQLAAGYSLYLIQAYFHSI